MLHPLWDASASSSLTWTHGLQFRKVSSRQLETAVFIELEFSNYLEIMSKLRWWNEVRKGSKEETQSWGLREIKKETHKEHVPHKGSNGANKTSIWFKIMVLQNYKTARPIGLAIMGQYKTNWRGNLSVFPVCIKCNFFWHYVLSNIFWKWKKVFNKQLWMLKTVFLSHVKLCKTNNNWQDIYMVPFPKAEVSFRS